MDAVLATAAHALQRGDPLLALGQVALRTEPLALALRATALAQLGEFDAARQWFRRARQGFGPDQPVARARCTIGLADVALASRELTFPDAELVRAIALLTQKHDHVNALYGQLLRARHALARGQVEATRAQLSTLDAPGAPPAWRALLALTQAEVALRSIAPRAASAALGVATSAAREARIPALLHEVSSARQALRRPVARLVRAGESRLITLEQVARLYAQPGLLVDGCRRVVRADGQLLDLSARPVLFNLLRALAELAPEEVAREQLIRTGFGITRASESLRVRLRMSMTRLRKLLAGSAEIVATTNGFALSSRKQALHVLLPPVDDAASSLLALIADGEAWSTSALALALGSSQRSVQRALGALLESDKVRSTGRGKDRRWLAMPLTRFATPLLLPASR